MSLVDELRTYFDDLDARDGFPGVALVADGATTVYEGAFGLASRAWGVRNGINTRFDTASITKLFTATAVLQMIDAGRLSFDTPVVAYLGLSETTISSDVTVRHLLTHTSRIGNDADEEAGEQYADLWRDTPNYSVINTADFLPQFATKPANFAPGAGCRYNNVGYVLLGLCVERASGMSYRDYVRSRVFAPAGMDRSDFFRMDDVAPDVAEGADPVLDADEDIASWRRNIYSYPPVGSPDGGAHVTAHDHRDHHQQIRARTGVPLRLERQPHVCPEGWNQRGYERTPAVLPGRRPHDRVAVEHLRRCLGTGSRDTCDGSGTFTRSLIPTSVTPQDEQSGVASK